MIRLAFCNNNGGGGKSTLVFHLAHMLADLGHRTLIVDLDPQSSLTAMCVPEQRLEELWSDDPQRPLTIMGWVAQFLKADGQGHEIHVESLRDGLGLIPGDLGLSTVEPKLAEAWAWHPTAPSLRALSVFHRAIEIAALQHSADVVSINVGPNLGAINRAALLAAHDGVVVPLSPDPFAVEALRSLGPALRDWHSRWEEIKAHQRMTGRPFDACELPRGSLWPHPLGYVVMQEAMRLARPVQAYDRWLRRIPSEYHGSVLDGETRPATIEDDPSCLGIVHHYPGLAALARDAGKPMFALRPADGATGSYTAAVQRCREDFESLARMLLRLDRADLPA